MILNIKLQLDCTVRSIKYMYIFRNTLIHTDLLSVYHALIILVVNKQLMHWVHQDHAMAYVVLVDVIQELVQIIGNQVLVFEKVY